jgi:hypothetical protein
MLRVVYCVENYTPLSDINRGVLEEVIEENLENENVFISDAEKLQRSRECLRR